LHQWLAARQQSAGAWRTAALLVPHCCIGPVDEQRRHLARLICGAFTNRQAAAAAKSLGFDSAEAGRATLRQLRLLRLEHIDNVFSDRKEAARA
jgi:hypothetical protein